MAEIRFTESQVLGLKASIAVLVGVTFFQALSIQRMHKALESGRANFDALFNSAQYLLNVINEHDIELSEFDVIAITHILEGNSNG